LFHAKRSDWYFVYSLKERSHGRFLALIPFFEAKPGGFQQNHAQKAAFMVKKEGSVRLKQVMVMK